MRQALVLFVALLLAAAGAHAHGGKSHQLLGTVERLQENDLVVKDKDGAERTVALTADTRIEKAGKAAKRADLVRGARVSVHFAEDDRTAVSIKIGAAAPQ